MLGSSIKIVYCFMFFTWMQNILSIHAVIPFVSVQESERTKSEVQSYLFNFHTWNTRFTYEVCYLGNTRWGLVETRITEAGPRENNKHTKTTILIQSFYY